MSQREFFLFLVLFAFVFQNCQPDETTPVGNVESVVFGHFFGECVGEECIEIFKIEDGILYEDKKDNYPSFVNPYDGEYESLPDNLFQAVKDLETLVPDQLLEESETVIGQPDAGDWGGYYFEISQDGVRNHYRIDKMKDNLHEYLKDFADVLANYIELAQG